MVGWQNRAAAGGSGDYLWSMSIFCLETNDLSYQFSRHKSFMVALGRIDTVERDTIRIGQAEIPISETYRKAFLQAIG